MILVIPTFVFFMASSSDCAKTTLDTQNIRVGGGNIFRLCDSQNLHFCFCTVSRCVAITSSALPVASFEITLLKFILHRVPRQQTYSNKVKDQQIVLYCIPSFTPSALHTFTMEFVF